ncbi:MAG: NEW3 domain-containing protein, partial [Armatimonadota bacterium]|nr:NEW3 domain-containing protein [Armatimonadota bacterium]
MGGRCRPARRRTLRGLPLGSAPARGIKMSASAPGGWTVEFEPELIEQVEPGSQVEVT